VGLEGSEHDYLATGRPMYWAWAPDGENVVAHSGSGPGGTISVVGFEDSSSSEDRLSQQPSSFHAPAYSPDGSLIAAAVEGPEGQNRLAVFPPAGVPAQTIAELRGFTAFDWSPDGRHIAYIDGSKGPIGGLRGQLHVVTPEPIPSTVSMQSGSTRIPAGDGVIAFFWSRDGSKLAFFRPVRSTSGQQQRIILTLFVYDIEAREVRRIGTFPASRTFAYQVLGNFDQYQRSTTIWSPDGSSLVLSGMENRQTPAVYVVPLDGSDPTKIAEGHLAFWRPGPPSDLLMSYFSKTMD
jgi:Tol biopolymer transport system component